MQRAIALLVLAAFFLSATGCAHSVILDTEPSGGEIKVNGEKLGTGPVTYNETTGWEKVYDIEGSKPGFKPIKKQIRQTEWNVPIVLVSVGGILLLWWLIIPIASPVGFLWSRQLPDRITLGLEKGTGGAPATGPGDHAPSYGY